MKVIVNQEKEHAKYFMNKIRRITNDVEQDRQQKQANDQKYILRGTS